MPTTTEILQAAARYAVDRNWKALRRAVAYPTCREISPYHYSRNGLRCRERTAGIVALRIENAAFLAGMPLGYYEDARWCGLYPRTKSSLAIEAAGIELFERSVAWCAEYVRSALNP